MKKRTLKNLTLNLRLQANKRYAQEVAAGKQEEDKFWDDDDESPCRLSRETVSRSIRDLFDHDHVLSMHVDRMERRLNYITAACYLGGAVLIVVVAALGHFIKTGV